MKLIPAALAVMMILTPQNPAAAASYSLSGVEWQLVKVQGVAIDASGTIKFEDDRMAATSGCNNFWAPFQLDGETGLDVGPPQSARVYCPGRSSMERAYFAALEMVTSYVIEGTTLKLQLGDGNVYLEFVK